MVSPKARRRAASGCIALCATVVTLYMLAAMMGSSGDSVSHARKLHSYVTALKASAVAGPQDAYATATASSQHILKLAPVYPFTSSGSASPVPGSKSPSAELSRGVVLMGNGKSVRMALMAVHMLRATGCSLPVEYAYLRNELKQSHLDLLAANNITARDYWTPEIESFKWSKNSLRLGAPKVDAILSSPFQQLLFLDPDVMPLRDPTYLFETNQFRKTGALFWPDFKSTPKTSDIWKITSQPYEFEFEFESGQIVLDKSRNDVLLALKVAHYFCRESAYFFKIIWGDKDAFRWGFKVAGVDYFLNKEQVVSVGVAVDWFRQTGNVSLIPSKSFDSQTVNGPLDKHIISSSGVLPRGGVYCGQNMLQMDFNDQLGTQTTPFQAKPLFMHANGIKKYYIDNIPPFQIAQMYQVPLGKTLTDLQVGSYDWLGWVRGQHHCGRLSAVAGVETVYIDFTKAYPGLNERYIEARRRGGKDSCFNVMHCMANGHDVVAVANLFSQMDGKSEEIDSFMYQTVGSNVVVPLIAECLGLPLFRRCIRGASVSVTMDYQVESGDEVEDLMLLLKDVLIEMPDVQAVSVGAILSNYQRIRVEHVCSRLGLTVLSYLWQADQSALLNSMIECNVNAILVKVAAIGLETKHLGKSLAQMQPLLETLSNRFGCHVCGEGGEYETVTVDCPIFKKRIVIVDQETIIHSNDAFAIVAYLKFGNMALEEKDQHEVGLSDDLKDRLLQFGEKNYVTSSDLKDLTKKCNVAEDMPEPLVFNFGAFAPDAGFPASAHVKKSHGYLAIGGIRCTEQVETVEDETRNVMDQIEAELRREGFEWSDVVMMQLFVSDMNDFGTVNKVYGSYLGINPPTRVTVEVGYHEDDATRIQIDCLAFKTPQDSAIVRREFNKSVMHVQGVSYWAPSNIGPYSQTVKLNDHLFMAGQIGLIPNQMALPNFSMVHNDLLQLLAECVVAFNNIEAIATVQGVSFPEDVGSFLCFVRCPEYLSVVERFCASKIPNFHSLPRLFLSVSKLPRNCAVEFQVMFQSVKDLPPLIEINDEEMVDDLTAVASVSKSLFEHEALTIRAQHWSRGSLVTFTGECVAASGAEITLQTMTISVKELVRQIRAASSAFGGIHPVSIRVFHLKSIPRRLLMQEFTSVLGKDCPSLSFVPVNRMSRCLSGYLGVHVVFPHRI
ncbi:ATP binding domain 4 [Chytriomyces hyalinus]|nr:ATP binding domain 4 [Chytriomyces hyalinus]